MPPVREAFARDPRVPPTPLQSAVYDVLWTVSDAQLGVRRVELVVEQARELFHNGFDRSDSKPFDAVEAILYSAAALLREVYAELEAADLKHREAVK